jgi:hypothetical protein
MLMTVVRPSIYLPCCALVWSGVSAATAGVTNYQGLVAARFMLGLVEAPLFPGVGSFGLQQSFSSHELTLLRLCT